MTEREFAADILARLPFQPNGQQMQTALALARFCARTNENAPSAERVFVLNGYAGTGKTSLTGALVKSLTAMRIPVVLMAPTGRSAKVFAAGSGAPASTIHRKIYRHVLPGTPMSGAPAPQENKLRDAIFIVDEASMIGAESGSADGSSLLADLIHYVYSSPGCRLILQGDTAQLPPVGQADSPAMNPDVLRSFGLKVTRVTLTDVARQAAQSGILRNATLLRKALTSPPENKLPGLIQAADVVVVEPDELPETIDSLYRRDGVEETIVITRSNLTATQFNKGIRGQVLGYEEELSPGDLLIAVKNNYHWAAKVKGLGFVANGEILRLKKVYASEARYGMRFADVVLEIADRPGMEFDAKIHLGPLHNSAAALDPEESRRIYQGVYTDPTLMPADADHNQRMRLMRTSPYWNALAVKYAYAVTCHKAQGGQWRNVVVDLSYIPPEQVGGEFYRWLYTAVTRARSNLYLIRPPEEMLAK